MLFCDIGNTTYSFFDEKTIYKKSVDSFKPSSITTKVYYISVNEKVTKKLQKLENWIDLESCISRDNYYNTMGIDRIFLCESLKNGVVVDAGSAITVDIVKDGKFLGGFIYPGIQKMKQTYKNISKKLDFDFNFNLNLSTIPKNSQDSISYGYLKGFFIEVNSYNLPIILTGGDAKYFKKIFTNATVDEGLIFKAMKKIQRDCNC
jgi:type III pantothenate kinase